MNKAMLIRKPGVKFFCGLVFISMLTAAGHADSLAAEYKPWKFNSVFNNQQPASTIPGPTPPVVRMQKPNPMKENNTSNPDKNGILKNNAADKDDKKEDIVKQYYDDGRLSQETRYKNGLKEGEQRIYRKNGKMNLTITYAKDMPVSGMCYHSNGNKTSLTNAELMNRENGFSIVCD
jgi:hypothetical protein